MNLILFATTSGATKDVATRLANILGGACTRLVDLKVDTLDPDCEPDWIFAGTPTYGKGDWHYAWMQRHREAAPLLMRARHVALFGIGDSVHHTATFAGGIGHLNRFCRELGVVTEGALGEARRSSPALENGKFPGLVFEYGHERRRVEAMIVAWLRDLRVTDPSCCQFRGQAVRLT